jgi:hypothetical protein
MHVYITITAYLDKRELYYGNGRPKLLSAQNKAERNADEGGLVCIGGDLFWCFRLTKAHLLNVVRAVFHGIQYRVILRHNTTLVLASCCTTLLDCVIHVGVTDSCSGAGR